MEKKKTLDDFKEIVAKEVGHPTWVELVLKTSPLNRSQFILRSHVLFYEWKLKRKNKKIKKLKLRKISVEDRARTYYESEDKSKNEIPVHFFEVHKITLNEDQFRDVFISQMRLLIPDTDKIEEKIEALFESNQQSYKGSNESFLHFKQELADWIKDLFNENKVSTHRVTVSLKEKDLDKSFFHGEKVKFSEKDLKEAYAIGFTDCCSRLNENMYDSHYYWIKEGFSEWIEKVRNS
jgi:hypothetical protein